jgi:hypothetical protein
MRPWTVLSDRPRPEQRWAFHRSGDSRVEITAIAYADPSEIKQIGRSPQPAF